MQVPHARSVVLEHGRQAVHSQRNICETLEAMENEGSLAFDLPWSWVL